VRTPPEEPRPPAPGPPSGPRPDPAGQPRPRRNWAEVESGYSGDELELSHRRSARYRRPSPGRSGRRRRRLAGYVVVAVLALVVGLGVGWARAYFSIGPEGRQVMVVIPAGATLSDIGSDLAAKGVVPHARSFVLRAQQDGYSTSFKPGMYVLHINQPYDSLVAQLVKGARPLTVKVSIPEGTTLKQASHLVAARVSSITSDDYVKVARDDPPPFRLGGYKPGTTLEGMLFPATYDVAPKADARTFVEQQLAAFKENFSQVDMTRAKKANLTKYDVVIIASMIEREVRLPSERTLVAAVIWNRLRAHMLLQIDATIQYALGKTKPVLTYQDLKIDSPYNTYKHAGLPPTPISNPGLAALKAAADPANVKYLYYVARNDGTGGHYFSSDYAQFLVDKAKAKANNGQ
jgi:UPF0755 protein